MWELEEKVEVKVGPFESLTAAAPQPVTHCISHSHQCSMHLFNRSQTSACFIWRQASERGVFSTQNSKAGKSFESSIAVTKVWACPPWFVTYLPGKHQTAAAGLPAAFLSSKPLARFLAQLDTGCQLQWQELVSHMKATTQVTQVTLVTTDQKDSVWLVGLPLLCVPAFSYLFSSESRRPQKPLQKKLRMSSKPFWDPQFPCLASLVRSSAFYFRLLTAVGLYRLLLSECLLIFDWKVCTAARLACKNCVQL